MQEASGTSHDPAAVARPMLMTQVGKWMLMAHGSAFVNQVVETGRRGADRFFSTNWIMGMADRPIGGSDGHWSSRVIWGWNHKSNNDSNGLVAETVFRFREGADDSSSALALRHLLFVLAHLSE